MMPGNHTLGTDILKDPVLKLQEWSRDLVDWAEEGVSSFSAGDWVLIALAGAALFWIVASLRAMTRLGPIEIDTLEHDGGKENGGGDAVAVKAPTGALRQKLNDNGLTPPPAVPAGTPQVNLIAAVEASSIPQGAFIAKLLELLPKPPRPPQYTVTGVLTGTESGVQRRTSLTGSRTSLAIAPPGTGVSTPGGPQVDGRENGGPCGLTYWVRPSCERSALLKTVERCGSHSDAVKAAAFEIYQHVSNDAIHAFPVWARWRRAKSLEAYLEGCRPCPPGEPSDAVRHLEIAARLEPFNALVRLHLANLYERCVPSARGFKRAHAQTHALRRYLSIASDWPELVEARYRASVLAGALATSLEVAKPPAPGDLTVQEQLCIRKRLALPDVDSVERCRARLRTSPGNVDTVPDLRSKLRTFAARESKAVLQLLKPWYAPLHEHRLRNQFEPRAHERRELKHTVSISKHCVRMRALGADSATSSSREVAYRKAAVHIGHLLLGRGAINWQTHYNAACFDALLLQYLRVRAAGVPTKGNSKAQEKARERALRHLDTAIKEADDQLSASWVERDPDFAVFTRPTDERWKKLVDRSRSTFRSRRWIRRRCQTAGSMSFPFRRDPGAAHGGVPAGGER
jgi:hypothetical protein